MKKRSSNNILQIGVWEFVEEPEMPLPFVDTVKHLENINLSEGIEKVKVSGEIGS